MSPHPFATALARRWFPILVVALLGVGVAFAILSAVPPTYRAQAEVLVAAPTSQSLSAVPERTVSSYAVVLGGRAIANRVVEGLGLSDSVDAVDDRLSGEVVDDTAVLRVTATADDGDDAAQLAQEAAEQFVTWIESSQGDEIETALTAIVVATAESAEETSPSQTLWLVVGGLAGLALGLLLAAARASADRSVRSPAELEEISGAPVLGAMTYDRTATQTPLITSLGTHHPRFEAIRILRTNLQFLDIDRDNKVITVTSSLAGEGKSTTACNLAIALAQTGSQVVLVEGDLRRPRVSEYLGVEKSVGLTTVLVGRITLDAALQPAGTPGMDVLTSGSLPPNPSEILQTQAMSGLIAELRHRYDVVLIDAPPLLPVTDAALLASISDGAILVVRHGETGREQVRTAAERLSSVGARLLGTVLSMTPARELAKYGYGYGYGYGPEYFERTTAPKSRGGARRS